MANKNIWQMDALPAVANDTMIPVIATDDDASTNNKMSSSQFAAYVGQYMASLTRTAYVGTGAQYAYQSMFQAWDALGSPLNIHVCTNIVEDGNIVLSATNSYLSITHAYDVTVNWEDYSIICADVTRAVLKINGSFAIWRRSFSASKAFIDFATTPPQNSILDIQNLIDDDQSDQSYETPFIIQDAGSSTTFCNIKNVTLNLNNNGFIFNYLFDAYLENITLVCNSGRDSNYCISLAGSSKINGLKIVGDFRAGAVVLFNDKYASYDNVYNLASAAVSVITFGGHGSNLYGVNNPLNINIFGDEASIISPKVVNANNCTFTFGGGVAENGSATITNADVVSIDNNGLTSGNFKFVNCQIPTQLNWVGGGEVVQFTSCNFQQGYSIESPNTIMVNGLAGLSSGGSTENIKVDGGDGSLILAVQGNADFDDPTIVTDDVQQGYNKTLT